MTRHTTSPSRAPLAALGGVAVLVWCVASAFSPSDSPSVSAAPLGTSAEPSSALIAPGALDTSATRLGTSGPVLASRPSTVAHVQVARASASLGGALASRAAEASPGDLRGPRASGSLPGADTLPASAMDCTFEHDGVRCGECRTDSECPAQQGCVANRRTRRFECMASECEQDAHCFPGTVCRAVSDGASGPRVRRCLPEGHRAEGERCATPPVGPEDTCQEGLLCVRQLCGRPCQPDVSGSCPSGQRCVEGPDGAGCYPDCRTLGCARDEACTRIRDETYQCLEAVRGECNEAPCAEGEACNLRMAHGRAAFWCAPRCNPLQPDSCAQGQVCGRGGPTQSTCFQRCDPRALDACNPGWRCTSVTEDMTQWGCVPVP